CPVSASSLSEESSEDELTLLRRLCRLSSESELGGLSLGERLCPSLLWTSSIVVFMSVQVLQVSRLRRPKSRSFEIRSHSAPNSGPLFRRGGGGGSVVFVPGTVWGGVVKVARCRPSVLVIVAVVWVVPRGGPIAMKTRSHGPLALPEACLEICLEGVRWVKFPCVVILDFGSILSVVSHGWRQSVDTKVG
ncbi:hypothetical protein Tco_1299438, partial [Tanacetum coccineum]